MNEYGLRLIYAGALSNVRPSIVVIRLSNTEQHRWFAQDCNFTDKRVLHGIIPIYKMAINSNRTITD